MESTCPFETPLSLSERDHRSMHRLAQHCIDETIIDYEYVLASKSGLPSATRWKPVKKKNNVVVYQDQLAMEEIKRRKRKAKSLGDIIESNRVGDMLSKSVGPGTFRSSATAFTRETEVMEMKELPNMIWMGTVECDLDDIMYGLVSQSDEVTRINASYSGNDVQDFATLASLESSTPSDPFHGLQLKWEVNSALTKAKPVWHNRDFVYLEATGLTTSGVTGQRIGYQILHSLDIRGAPELPECKLVRGKVAIYQLFRQKSKGTVEIFAKAMVDLAGTVPSSIGSLATIEAANSANYAAKCARKRKLNWLMTTTDDAVVNSETDRDESCCSVCTRQIRATFTRKLLLCHICTNRVCHRCHVRQKLSFIEADDNSFVVKQKALDLCTRCVHTASHMNARRVALEERALEDPASMYKYIPRQMKATLEASQEDSMLFENFVSSRGAINGVEYLDQRTILLDQAL